MEKCHLSIAMCTYNGARFLAEQLESIAAQTRLPDELIVCDDRSNDETVQIVKDFSRRAPFTVELVVNERNLGSTKNFEKAIRMCRGDVIALADQDDVWYPDRLSVTEAAFTDNPLVGAVFADADVVDNALNPLGYRLWDVVLFSDAQKRLFAAGRPFEALLAHNVVTGATLAFRSKYLPLVCPIPAEWVHDGWIAILIAGVDIVLPVSVPAIKYRQHSEQQIGAHKRDVLGRFWNTQRACNHKFYLRMPIEYRAVFERLSARLEEDSQTQLLLLQNKIKHLERRAALPKSHFLRLPRITAEFVLNRYRKYGYGWKGAVRDLLVNLDG
jgi:glycosyltransferase involved in cell wall biosynthesis